MKYIVEAEAAEAEAVEAEAVEAALKSTTSASLVKGTKNAQQNILP